LNCKSVELNSDKWQIIERSIHFSQRRPVSSSVWLRVQGCKLQQNNDFHFFKFARRNQQQKDLFLKLESIIINGEERTSQQVLQL
jgi:hypothetical protein